MATRRRRNVRSIGNKSVAVMKGITLQQLRTFAAVAKYLSFGKAAEKLCVTQPAVSMQIRELEGAVEASLFDRESRRVSLTTPGEYLLVYARRMLATLKDAEDAMSRLRGVDVGRLCVGINNTGNCFLPGLLGGFLAEHPGVELQLVVGNRQTLIEMIQRNELDLALMDHPPYERSIRAEPFAPHPSALVAWPTHPLLVHKRVAPAMLADERFLVREPGSSTRAAMEKFLRDHHLHPGRVMEIGSNEAIKHAVAARLGISFLSLYTLKSELQASLLRILDVEGLPMIRHWQVVHTLSKTLSPAAEALRYYLLEHGERFLEREFGELFPDGLLKTPVAVRFMSSS